LIGSGSVDSTAKLINSQNGKVIATFQCGTNTSTEEDNTDSVESVGFSGAQSLFASGTVNGSIEIWDISTQTRRHLCQQNSGISKLLWDQNNPYILYTAGLDGVLRIYDGRSGQLQTVKNGHSDHILDFSLSSDSSFVLTASEDSTCRLFSLS
jgi:ribosome assembly protein SQT1